MTNVRVGSQPTLVQAYVRTRRIYQTSGDSLTLLCKSKRKENEK